MKKGAIERRISKKERDMSIHHEHASLSKTGFTQKKFRRAKSTKDQKPALTASTTVSWLVSPVSELAFLSFVKWV